MYDDEEVYDFLEHFGVKGMRWGQRKAARQRNRELNKATRAKMNEQRNKEIDRARARFDSGKARRDYLKAKEEFKKNKTELGSLEARRILNKTKEKNMRDFEKAQQTKSGKETTVAVLATVGVLAASMLFGAATNKNF